MPNDLFSFYSHAVGALVAMMMGGELLSRTINYRWAIKVYVVSLVVTLMTSALAHHGLQSSPAFQEWLDVLDHCCVYLLIAGTYTPLVVLVVRRYEGVDLLQAVWCMAIVLIAVKCIWPRWPDELTVISCIALGGVMMLDWKTIRRGLSNSMMAYLVGGAAVYIVGGICFAFNWPANLHPEFGAHEIHHVCVLVGAACHFKLISDLVRKFCVPALV